MRGSETRSTGTVFAFLASWFDGLWLCVGFAIACFIAFAIPASAFAWAANAAGPSVLTNAIRSVGAMFLIIASPALMSRMFRELDYTAGRGRDRGKGAAPASVSRDV